MSAEKPNFYAVLPADVRYDENIPPNAKLLYAEISALIGKEGYCYASNAYFYETFGFSEKTVARLINALEDHGYVKRVISRDNKGQVDMRKIYLKASMPEIHPPDNFDGTSSQNCPHPPDKNDGSTITSITNIEKENKKEKASVSKSRIAMDDEQLSNTCIEWINAVGHDWERDLKNAVYIALTNFYAPREDKKHTPSRTSASFTALSNRLGRYSKGDPTAMVDMLERAVTAGWKSVYPPLGNALLQPASKREEEGEWL